MISKSVAEIRSVSSHQEFHNNEQRIDQADKSEYQTYREALSLIRFGLSGKSQIESFDFLSEIYKQSPSRLRPVFVMALISTITSFHHAFTASPSEKTEGGTKP